MEFTCGHGALHKSKRRKNKVKMHRRGPAAGSGDKFSNPTQGSSSLFWWCESQYLAPFTRAQPTVSNGNSENSLQIWNKAVGPSWKALLCSLFIYASLWIFQREFQVSLHSHSSPTRVSTSLPEAYFFIS